MLNKNDGAVEDLSAADAASSNTMNNLIRRRIKIFIMLRNKLFVLGYALMLNIVLGFGFVASVEAAPPTYKIFDIGTLENASGWDLEDMNVESWGKGLNNNGQVVGWSYTTGGAIHTFIWDMTNGITDINVLNGIDSRGGDINNNGQVTGSWNPTNSTDDHVFIWDPTTGFTDLGALGGTWVEANGINDNGKIVGFGCCDNSTVAFIGDATNGLTALDLLGGPTGRANDINNSSQVTGSSDGQAFIWDATNGTTWIGAIGGLEAYSEGFGINDFGQLTGDSCIDAECVNTHAYLWNPTDGFTDIGSFGGTETWGNAINNVGQVVGDSDIPAGEAMHAFYWDAENGMLDLNDLVVDLTGWRSLNWAEDINDSGCITGAGRRSDGSIHAFFAAPLPCPLDICNGDFDVDGDIDGADINFLAVDCSKMDCSGSCKKSLAANIDKCALSLFASNFGLIVRQ